MLQYIRMNKQTKKIIVLKQNFKNLMSTLLPMAKKVISNKINQIKSRIIQKIRPKKETKCSKKGI